ncbi:MAG: MMPL family transporter, partial [Myxococcales bacterium]|nr:MMPL family transporter [Myxococcales bacterium]
LVAIAVVAREGTIFTPHILGKVRRITDRLDGVGYDSRTAEREALRAQLEASGLSPREIGVELDRTYPPYPVNHDRVNSLAARSTRVVTIEADGAISSEILMKGTPETQAEANRIRELVLQNPPLIYGRLVSLDERGAFISADFVSDRLNSREVYQAVFDHVQRIKAEEEDDKIAVYVSGEPVHQGWIIEHAFQIGLFVALTVLVTFLLLLLYFRRLHGVLIPFIAALATALWGLGFTGWWGITFDPLVLVIPMIITARAVSHTVQMAERFFEDYERLVPQFGDDTEGAKREAATQAMAQLIVPGTLGIITDFLGLLVILITTIPQMRDLAFFGAFWVISILFTVEILHPVMICYLPAPHDSKHYLPGFMVRMLTALGNFVTHPVGKWVIAGSALLILAGSTLVVLRHSTIGEANPGSFLLWPDHEFNVATAEIAERFGGVDSFVVYADGDRDNANADPEPIKRLEEFERWMKQYTDVGATISVVPIIRSYWQQNHYGDPKWQFVPDEPGTVRNVLFQLKTNGPPGFLRPFMTDDSREANIQFFFPDHRGDTIRRAVEAARRFIVEHPIGAVNLRLDRDRAADDAPFFSRESLLDKLYYMIGPMLPERNHTLSAALRRDDGSFEIQTGSEITTPSDLPGWAEEFREGALADYAAERERVAEGETLWWPERLADWELSDVDAFWEDEELGIRALAVNTRDLIVQDRKAVDQTPQYQPTNSWTRGVQFVLAGGVMGILAAVNDEVERGHIANISLILLVIYLLQTLVYRSLWSGTIIVIQLATATMLSLAYMAWRDVGLNINTLPVQSVGVGIGVDYAIYIVDRIRQEVVSTGGDMSEAVRRAIRTTGMAVSFTATTIVGGIALWMLSDLRFQAEMAQLLVILMVINMLGALTIVPAFYAIVKPRFTRALLDESAPEPRPVGASQ